MIILHVVQIFVCAGIERMVLSMLQRSFSNTYIFVLQLSEEESIKKWPVISKYKEHIFFANIELNGKRKTIQFLKKICKKLSVTTIHTHYTGPLLYATLATLGQRKMTHVHTEHDSWHLRSWKNRIIEQILITVKKNIKIVAVSKQIKTELVNYFPRHKPTLIYNGVNINEFHPGNKQTARNSLNLPQSAIIVCSVGRLSAIKGHQYVIEAIKKLPEQYHLAIAGEGPLLEELINLAHQLKIEERVHFYGLVENPSLFYRACDLFCLPSLHEGLPLVLLEAQATNLPIVCTDVGGCSEAINPESSILIEPKNSYAIAQACLNICERKDNPREFIIKNFSLDAMESKYNKLYQGSENNDSN